MTGGEAVLVEGLHRDFGDRPVLRDIRVELASGESLTVLGPNGAGKTTLLRILAGLLRPGPGRVSVLGADLPGEAWRVRGRIGFLGHDPILYRDLTGRENLRFHARLHGLAGDAGERINRLLDAVKMGRRADEPVRWLSRGMAQRLAVCRCVLHEPDLLLLDEPASHLDPDAVDAVEPLIGRGSGRTRVLVSHDVERAVAEADQVLALGHGGDVAYRGPAGGYRP
jgi:heme exporter protein A